MRTLPPLEWTVIGPADWTWAGLPSIGPLLPSVWMPSATSIAPPAFSVTGAPGASMPPSASVPVDEIATRPDGAPPEPAVVTSPATATEVPLSVRLPPGCTGPVPPLRSIGVATVSGPLDWSVSERPAVQLLSPSPATKQEITDASGPM